VIDKGDIESAKTVGTAGGVEIFAAGLNLQDFRLAHGMAELIGNIAARVLVAELQLTAAG